MSFFFYPTERKRKIEINKYNRKLNSLKDYQNAFQKTEENIEFHNVFKFLSKMFFDKFAIRYLAYSKINKYPEKRQSFISSISKFLKGIDNPESFKKTK